MAASKQIRSALESMMFTWGEPLGVRTAVDVLNVQEAEVKEAFEALTEEYEQEQRGIRVRRINKGYQFVTVADLLRAAGDIPEEICAGTTAMPEDAIWPSEIHPDDIAAAAASSS